MISIIVTTYNDERYVAECLTSVLSQTYSNKEIIVVDDGSVDTTRDIIKEFEKASSIRTVFQSNKGPSSARNTGIANAVGNFICFVDGDDIISKDYVAQLKAAQEKRDADIVICGMDLFIDSETDGRIVFESHPGTKNFFNSTELIFDGIYPAVNTYTVNPPVCKLYRRSIILENKLKFSPDLSIGEDLLFNLDYLQHCQTAELISGALYHYRRDSSVLTTRYSGDFETAKKQMLDRSYDILRKYGYSKQFYNEYLIHVTFSYLLELPTRLPEESNTLLNKLRLIKTVKRVQAVSTAMHNISNEWALRNRVMAFFLCYFPSLYIYLFCNFIDKIRGSMLQRKIKKTIILASKQKRKKGYLDD